MTTDAPTLDTSLTHNCDGKDCKGVGIWHPVLIFRYKGASRRTDVRGMLPIRLCDDCRKITTVASMLTDALWLEVVSNFLKLNRKSPKRNLTGIDFADVGGAEARTFFKKIPDRLQQTG